MVEIGEGEIRFNNGEFMQVEDVLVLAFGISKSEAKRDLNQGAVQIPLNGKSLREGKLKLRRGDRIVARDSGFLIMRRVN